MSLWLLCVLLSSLIGQTKQDGHLLPVKDVTVRAEDAGVFKRGAWVLNVEWRDGFVENTESKTRLYDIEVLHTEQMRTVHYDTIQVKPNLTKHHWNWKSPLPLQCTSHSVRLRRRDQHQTGVWSPLYTYKGQDLSASSTTVLPYDQEFLVGSNITFCCIVRTEKVPSFSSSDFTIRISNRTYITKPLHIRSPLEQMEIGCDDNGATVYIGYAPDDRNLTCITRDLRSVECRWESGRDTYLKGKSRETKYTLNGRDCEFHQCILPVNNVTKWILTARNPLGVTVINDTADPLHRVWLKAPQNILSSAVHERKVTLQWSWNGEQYVSFSMICQVELNGRIYNKTFSGKGLDSIILVDLQPSVDYTATVSCGSSQHFYRWGDWSKRIHFRTKEDIPEAVDVWMQYLEQNTYVLWKPLSREQSHGTLTGYELTMSDSEKVHIDPKILCHRISSGNESRDQMISVSAKNQAGLSPPASIIIPSYPDSNVNINRMTGSNGGFDVSWEDSFSSSCGYIVDWFPTHSKKECAVNWKKVPSGHLRTRIQEDFDEGVRYTVSVYSCIAGIPQLLQRGEGYATEQRPFGPVQNLRGKQNGRNLVLSWKEVPLDKQGGFILYYRVVTFHSDDSETPIDTKITKNLGVVLMLDAGSYTINVSAFTSAGEGVNDTFRITMEKEIGETIVATVLGSSVAALVFIIITFLCYRKKKWLKKTLYPDIPEPTLLGQWTTKGSYCAQMTDGYMKCEIQEVHSLDHHETSLETADSSALLGSNSRLCPAYDPYQNISAFPVLSPSPPEISSITVDSPSSRPCAKKLISVIENPTYNMTWPESVDFSQISEPTLEMQDSYLPASHFIQNKSDNKDGYKPQIVTS